MLFCSFFFVIHCDFFYEEIAHHFTMLVLSKMKFSILCDRIFQFLRIYYRSFLFSVMPHSNFEWLKFAGKLIFYAINFFVFFFGCYLCFEWRCGNATGYLSAFSFFFYCIIQLYAKS